MKRIWICVFMIGITTICQAAWDKTKPTNGGMIKNGPAEIRANWDAIELGTDSALQVTNDKVSATAAIADTKLATISTASKVSGAALTLLPNVPAGAGALPVANGGTGSATQNFVDLTTGQTVAGVKTFNSAPVLSVGADANNQQITGLLIENRTNDTGCTQTGRIWIRTDI